VLLSTLVRIVIQVRYRKRPLSQRSAIAKVRGTHAEPIADLCDSGLSPEWYHKYTKAVH